MTNNQRVDRARKAIESLGIVVENLYEENQGEYVLTTGRIGSKEIEALYNLGLTMTRWDASETDRHAIDVHLSENEDIRIHGRFYHVCGVCNQKVVFKFTEDRRSIIALNLEDLLPHAHQIWSD